jgi:predicted N-formylglutamate amidohydrolase
MNEMPDSLLAADEPVPVTVHNENGRSPFLIVADHAGNSIPRVLGRLGVSETECGRHIAWDIGIGAVCRLVADALDAMLVQQNYSRLVIDCNRTPGSETSIPETGEFTPIPGNVGLSKSRKATRVREIFRPYHDRIEAELDRRRKAGRPAALIAMHSFAPVFMGVARPWHVGVLYNRDTRFALSIARRISYSTPRPGRYSTSLPRLFCIRSAIPTTSGPTSAHWQSSNIRIRRDDCAFGREASSAAIRPIPFPCSRT